MRVFDLIVGVSESLSNILDTQDKNSRIAELEKEIDQLQFERDYAIELNEEKDRELSRLASEDLRNKGSLGAKLLSQKRHSKRK